MRPRPGSFAFNRIIQGDALSLIPTLPDRSVNLCLTSPPYALQRKRQYGGVAEKDYPAWMVAIMAALRPKLTDDASVLIVIRSHVRNGVVSDYVLRTRLALRDDGWCECEELLWLKPDAPPLGSKQRPRRTWEQILWFSTTPQPYIDLRANGGFSDRIGFVGSHRFRNAENPIATKLPSALQNGHARTPDHFTAFISEIENGIKHPAMFPASLCEKLIRTFSREGDVVMDPFTGSGTALLAAQRLGRKFVGFDGSEKYVHLATERLALDAAGSSAAPHDNGPAATDLVRLRHDFPQRPRLRRALLVSNGLTDSDVRVFEHVLQRTVLSSKHCAAAPLSVNSIASDIGLNRSTVIRSMRRLREQEFLETIQDKEWWRHRESQVGVAASILEAVPHSGGNGFGAATRSPAIRPGLHHADCFDGLTQLAPQSVQLVLTDLPTGATQNDWDVPLDLDLFWGEIRRIVKPNGSVLIFAAFPYDKLLAMSNFKQLIGEIIWKKEPVGFLNAKYSVLRAHENILHFSSGTPYFTPQLSPGEPYTTRRKATASSNYGSARRRSTVTVNDGTRHPTTVMEYRRDRDAPHPTAKPVSLLETLVRMYSGPGDLVCDPCAGSASTALAVANCGGGRQFVGFEKNRAIYEAALRRIRSHASALKLKG